MHVIDPLPDTAIQFANLSKNFLRFRVFTS